MSEAFPALVPALPTGAYVDSLSPDVYRLAVAARCSVGAYNVMPSAGVGAGAKTVQRFFASGTSTDMTVNGSSTNQVYTVTPASGLLTISVVELEMYTSNNLVFNGAAFGGRYYYSGGLLSSGYYAPAALTKGLLLQLTSGGVTTQIANLTVNEDFVASQVGQVGGSLTGAVDKLFCRFEMRQPLVTGTSDQLFWTVRDNMTNNQGIQALRAYAYGQVSS